MSSVANIQKDFQEAFPASVHGSVYNAIYEAYRFMKPLVEPRTNREFTLRRARSIHEGTIRRVDEAEKDAIEKAKAARKSEEEISRAEFRTLKDRIARLEAALAIMGEDHGGSYRRAMQQPAGGSGGVDSTGTRGDR